MRDSLTVLAILLIAVLTTALVGPYFVDWNAHRGAIEARLSALAGVPVAVGGPIDLKLLPKPVFRLGSVAIGGAGPYGGLPGGSATGPSLTAEEVDAELSLPALLRGQVLVVDATLVDPHLEIVQSPDGALALPRLPSRDAERVAVDHIGIRAGSAALRLADGRRLVLRDIDLDGEATTLRGPFKARGAVGGIPLRLATGALDGGRMRTKLGIEPGDGRPTLDLDGTLTLAGGPLAFEGALSAQGAIPLGGTPSTVPWRAAAEVRADVSGGALTDVEVRAGDDLRGLIADGSGTLVRGTTPDALPELALKLHGAGLDLDGLAVAPTGSGIAPPQGAALLGLLTDAAGNRPATTALPARLALDAGFDTVTIAGRTLLGATLGVGLGPDAGAAVALTAAGPNGARLALDGRIAPGPAFHGRADGAVADLPRFAAWLKPLAPDLAGALATVPGRALAAAGTLDASSARVAIADAVLRLDATHWTGSLAWDRPADTGRPRLAADLAVDRLDLGAPSAPGALPSLAGTVAPGLDLDVAVAAPAVILPGSAASGPVAGGPLAVHLRRVGGDLDLDRFSLIIGGASIVATGSRTGSQARAEAHVEAPALGPAVAILARVAPGPVTAALAARAAALSPATGALHAEASAAPDGTLVPTRLAIEGTFGGTRLAATLVPQGEGADLRSRPLTFDLHASAPDAAAPLRVIGLPATDGLIGAGTLAATARGSFAGGFAVEAKATLGSTALAYAGRAEASRIHGRLTLSSPDLRPLLAASGVLPAPADGDAVPAEAAGDLDGSAGRVAIGGIAGRVAGAAVGGDLAYGPSPAGAAPSELSGHLAVDRMPAAALLALGLGAPVETASAAPGAAVWSAAPFGPAPVLPIGAVRLAVARMPLLDGLEARDAALSVQATRTGVALADLSARLGGGGIDGGLALQRDGATATLAGRLAWHDIGLALGGLDARGAAGDLRFAASGPSPAALVANLGGTGTLSLAGGTLGRLDPGAPARVAAGFTPKDPLAEPDPRGPDPALVDGRLSDEFDRGPLEIGRQSVPIVTTGGVVGIAGLKGGGGGAVASTEAQVQLDTLALSLETRFAPSAGASPGAAPTGAVSVTQSGPLAGPLDRRVDATGLVERLQAEAVARAQERIDVMEQDLRERAYFNRQLKAIQADQAAAAAAAKAAAEARQAEAARAKADEARIQAETEAAARADAAKAAAAKAAAAKAEDEKRRFFDRETGGIGSPGTDPDEAGDRRRHVRPHEPLDLIPAPSIMREGPRASGQP